MIRLPPSTITLGASDLKGFENRQQQRKELESIHREFTRFEVGGQDRPGFGLPDQRANLAEDANEPSGDRRERYSLRRVLAVQTVNQSKQIPEAHASEGPTLPVSPGAGDTGRDNFPNVAEDEHGYQIVRPPRSPENESIDLSYSSPSKDDFHYGGFVESLTQQTVDDASQRSSPFVPGDISTPQHLQLPSLRGVRSRNLPRSPLFRSQNVSSSPEHRPTTSLTPRVVSRVATHNTPGYMFQRPPRRPTRAFRHQTNSFSFDESIRASAAYEQDRISSTSTTDSTHHLLNNVTLHAELRGSSLESSRVILGESSSSEVPEVRDVALVPQDADESQDFRREFLFSSPQLPLPPPFSAVSRSSSRADSLPSIPDQTVRNLAASPVQEASSPSWRGAQTEAATPVVSPASLPSISQASSPPSNGHGSRIFRTAARLVPFQRARSPLSRHGSRSQSSPSASLSTPPVAAHPGQINPNSAASPLQTETPHRNYRVYNDALSPATQPQTPASLPESRHQSRFHPSYTAPVTRAARMLGFSGDGTVSDYLSQRSRWVNATPSRRHVSRRSDSPIGLLDEGFRGLYGGRENGDEEQNWAEGLRFSNVEAQLWDGRILRETPEQEEWRPGRD